MGDAASARAYDLFTSRTAMPDAFTSFDVRRIDRSSSRAVTDQVAVERALEVRLEGEPFAIIMRTPGADVDLTIGFLHAEGVIRNADDLRAVESSDVPDVVNVRIARGRADVLPALFRDRRAVAANASCGICGRRSLEGLAVAARTMPVAWRVSSAVVAALPERLRAAQGAFDETGGLHAAGLFDLAGTLEASAEDVGRHNAVDKLVGRMLTAGRLPLDRSLLSVSGRTSFEIVQKACAAGIPLVAAVSAPSSLAIELARSAGITLVGFVRDGRLNSYAHHERIVTGAP
jgi:FdhD protein